MSIERITLDRAPAAARLSAATDLQVVADGRIADLTAAARALGRREGAEERVARAASLLEQAVQRLEEASALTNEEVARTAVRLSLEIARRILRQELPKRAYDIEAIVREALAHARTGRGVCVVHLHPDDAAALAGVNFRAGTRLEADPELARGDVHVETPQGLLVRDIAELLAQIEESLLESLSP